MSSSEKPTLLKRMAAIIYDSLLILAAMIILAFIWKLLLMLVGYENNQQILTVGYRVILFGLVFCFYQFFWLRGGQTLGMTAWRLKLVKDDESLLSAKDTSIRWFVALLSAGCCGLGYLWCVFDQKDRTWHDIISKTKIIVLPKP